MSSSSSSSSSLDGTFGGTRQRSAEIKRPTQTMMDRIGPTMAPTKPKIVVLGATGKIGRLVVQQLLELPNADDLTVVAMVRNYDKAIHIFYDTVVLQKKRRGPKLQIVQGDLVPREELPNHYYCYHRNGDKRRKQGNMVRGNKNDEEDDDDDEEEERLWMQRASSAASFYGTSISDYDNREYLPSINEALEDAIRDCTTIISCVGSVRPTNLWTDLLARPLWRLLRHDVSCWCQDPTHPYYVHYATTRKALGYAEREQYRREAAAIELAKVQGRNSSEIEVPRIRFVRISDLVVAHKPWNVVPVITNALQSMVFRYQEMAEQLLQQSTMLETVVLRPGDLIDEERVSSM